MITKITESSIRFPGIVILMLLAVVGAGIYKYNQIPVDAFPDISPVRVQVFTEAHGMAPEEIERLITYPIETTMSGLPGITQIKSTSAFGLSVVYVYFEDDTDIYFARQLVSERLTSALAALPDLHDPPTLGPISTGLGQIFIYYLTADPALVDTEGKELNTWLRELNDWVVKLQLQTVPGVTKVLSMGGHVLQYQIKINPESLHKYGLVLEDIKAAVRNNNRNTGGQFLVVGSEEYLVRGIGLLKNLDDLGNIPVKVSGGTPVLLSDVADVSFGNEIRRGAVTLNGEEEVVSGIVLKLFGENTSEVIERLYSKVEEVQSALPEGVNLHTYYEQAKLVKNATGTVKQALLIGALLVVGVLLFFLYSWRSALIVSLALPVCALTAVLFMDGFSISANLMSLGGIAIAIGMLGDGSIVMVENIVRHLGENREEPISRTIIRAADEVVRPIVFSIIIIIAVLLPIFTLEGTEGKMFSPLAFTITFTLLGSLVYAVVVAPVLSSLLLKKQPAREPVIIGKIRNIYEPLLLKACEAKKMVLIIALAFLISSLVILPFIGTEFIPTLEEGSIFIGVTMAPSISLEESTKLVMDMEKTIMGHPEVREVLSRIGRTEPGSHPHPVNFAAIQIEFKPDAWGGGFSGKRDLVETLNHELSEVPGVQLNFIQPIQHYFEELLSGVKAQLAIKLFGEDLHILQTKAAEIKNALSDIPGLVDLSVEQNLGQPQVQIIADRQACSRMGVSVNQIMEMVELAIGGEVVDQVFLDTRRFGIHIRYQEEFRGDPETIRNMLLATHENGHIPLGQLAEVKKVVGPVQINREKNQRKWSVQGNVRGRDMGSVVADIRESINSKVDLPPGYIVEIGGQYENQQRAMKRLMIIVPLAIAIVLMMLWVTFRSSRHAMVIISNIPLALIGGVLGLVLTGEYLSVPASVGFIALFGIAVQNGMVMVSYFNSLRERGYTVAESVHHGALVRLRPVLMTALTTVLGLFPLLLSTGIGSEVQRPLAVVVVFGLATSTLLTLFVLPVIYLWVEED
jgi:heavy metal efflux system protein